ncbi:CLUMA_CG020170, isoform A [Clunio marinus]|uniref:CLUMA_CG020170, isoform A n=1 Tax=Clunio marinus TaxID=568069 RepID=A0A1J1J8E6_9DIPT|nr:CLUMA_CG020170, isoform A [Clunio marinus]
MRDNTPPTSPYNSNAEDEIIYEIDDINEFEEVEELSDNEEVLEDENMEDVIENQPPERDDSFLTFNKHNSALFCGSFHPDGVLAVTGGEDDKAFVWKIETGEVVYEVTEHKDSVVAVEFSYDGGYLATADMAGEVKVFKVEKNYKKVWEYSMGDISWMKWHRKSNVLLAGSEVGEIFIWRIPSGECKVLQGTGEKCEVAMFTNDDRMLAAGYGDGTFKLWDVKNQQTVQNISSVTSNTDTENSEVSSIISLSTDSENNIVIAGCVDGTAKLFGPNGLIGHLTIPSSNSETSSVEQVLIDYPGFDLKIAVTGSLDGKVIIWDVAHQTLRNECKDENPTGITKLIWLKDFMVLGGTLGGSIKVWNIRNGEKIFTLLGHANNIHDIAYHKEKNLLLSVSEDKTAKIFKISDYF